MNALVASFLAEGLGQLCISANVTTDSGDRDRRLTGLALVDVH